MPENFAGKVSIRKPSNVIDAPPRFTIVLDGDTGGIHAGGGGESGDVLLSDEDNHLRIALVGRTAQIHVRRSTKSGPIGGISIMLHPDEGMMLFPPTASGLQKEESSIRLDGENGSIGLGNPRGIRLRGGDGHVQCRSLSLIDAALQEAIRMETVPGTAADEDLFAQRAGRLTLTSGSGVESIVLDGDAGDILLANADCAEEFDVDPSKSVEPGTVMVFDTQGALSPSVAPYDTRVAGVISGAGELKPGLVLGKQSDRADRELLALIGTVHCKVDADHAAISPGDLLTTSPTPGHAMRVGDRSKAIGAIMGKALQSLDSGRAHIPILVTLQ